MSIQHHKYTYISYAARKDACHFFDYFSRNLTSQIAIRMNRGHPKSSVGSIKCGLVKAVRKTPWHFVLKINRKLLVRLGFCEIFGQTEKKNEKMKKSLKKSQFLNNP